MCLCVVGGEGVGGVGMGCQLGLFWKYEPSFFFFFFSPSCGRLYVFGYYNCATKVGTYFILSVFAKNEKIFRMILLRNVY